MRRPTRSILDWICFPGSAVILGVVSWYVELGRAMPAVRAQDGLSSFLYTALAWVIATTACVIVLIEWRVRPDTRTWWSLVPVSAFAFTSVQFGIEFFGA